MASEQPDFSLRLARDEEDIREAQRLRYRVFVEELGGTGAMVHHDLGLEMDRFDPYFDHLLLIDETRRTDRVVGVYRLLPPESVAAADGYYSDDEYDLAPLRASGRRLLELGRSCVDAEYRSGPGMLLLWQALAAYVQEREIEILFGVASFHGTDIPSLAAPLSFLHHNHLAPPELRVRSREFQPMDLVDSNRIDRVGAARAIPALIKAYLRLGGFVGDGAFVDHPFNTTDVCLVMDTAKMNENAKRSLTRARA